MVFMSFMSMESFDVILDTGSSILWFPGEECDDSESKISHHYNYSASLTSKKTNYKYKIRYGTGYSLGYYYFDEVKLFNIPDKNNSIYMPFGVADKNLRHGKTKITNIDTK